MSKQERVVCAAVENTFKQIVPCIENGGQVQEFTTQMEVVAYLDSMSKKAVYLGHDRSISLEIPASELDDRDLYFIYIEAGEW